MIYPKLNQSLKWKNDYIFLEKAKNNNNVYRDLDNMFEDLKNSFSIQFSSLFYHVKKSQLKNSFYVLIRKKRGKVLGDKRKQLFDHLKDISENICNSCPKNNNDVTLRYFPYFCLIRNYGNYHFHFLVIRNEYR